MSLSASAWGNPVKITIEGTNANGEKFALEFQADDGNVSMDMERELIERGSITEVIEKHCVRWEYRHFQKNKGTILPGGIFIKGGR